ncbi:MAG: hypothetical protein BroJett011_51170 [Chloroflexota bacterium]|nr:MAG: hypothetical protein BroJett011_51170 [Chloroflexota bacterium]
MAKEDVAAILKKAATDDTFRLALSRDFENTIKMHGLQVDANELTALKQVDWQTSFNPDDMLAAKWVHIYS